MKVKLKDFKISEIIEYAHFAYLHHFDFNKKYEVDLYEKDDAGYLIKNVINEESIWMPKEWFEEVKELLTDEEKEILKTITKTSLSTIKKIKKDNDNSLSLISILGDYDCTHEFKYKYFKNLGLNKEYKLDELGLEE